MFKIVICVRNRLGITKKCIESICRHTKLPYEIYIYDNLTNYRLHEHFIYFHKLFQKKIIHQYTVNSNISTFNAFSKVVALNQFGHNHQMDPNKNKYDFLVFLDNDMIVTPDWDLYLDEAWKKIKTNKIPNIKIVTQYPGGVKFVKPLKFTIRNSETMSGKLGGSGFWAVNQDFFDTVGFLDCKLFIGKNKKHDQIYWRKLNKISRNKNYIMAIKANMVIHAGGLAGSVCNTLSKSKNDKKKLEKVKFKEVDSKIESLLFDDFYNGIKNESKLYKW